MSLPLSFSRRYWPVAALALLVQGCATTQWTKPGADASAMSRDLDACRAVALRSPGPPVAGVGGSEGGTERGSTRVMSPYLDSNERFVAEHADVNRCMQKRGYTLQRQG